MGGGGKSATPPKFVPVDIPKTASLATDYDVAAYNASDADFAARHPELVTGRDSTIADAAKQLGGNLGDKEMSALVASGLGSEGGKISTGNQFKTSRSSGQTILAKEQRDRNYFERILTQNPMRSTFSGADAVRIALGNTGNQNALNSSLFQSRVDQYNTQQQQAGQNIGAYANLFSGAAANFSKYYNQPQPGSVYIDPYNSVYNVAPYGYVGTGSGARG